METNQHNDTGGTGKPLMTSQEEPQQVPLSMMSGTGLNASVAGTDVYEEPRKGVPAFAMALFVVFLVGGGVMWAMRSTGGDSAPDASTASAESRIDAALKQMATSTPGAGNLDSQSIESLFQDADRVVSLFEDDPVNHQIAVEQLAKNPFELAGGSDVAVPGQPVNDSARDDRLKRLDKELAQLNLQSIMTGERSMAVISGKVLRVGGVVGSFTLTTIEKDRVVVTAEGETFELTLTRPNVGDE